MFPEQVPQPSLRDLGEVEPVIELGDPAPEVFEVDVACLLALRRCDVDGLQIAEHLGHDHPFLLSPAGPVELVQ
jgi:hypothetical protein